MVVEAVVKGWVERVDVGGRVLVVEPVVGGRVLVVTVGVIVEVIKVGKVIFRVEELVEVAVEVLVGVEVIVGVVVAVEVVVVTGRG